MASLPTSTEKLVQTGIEHVIAETAPSIVPNGNASSTLKELDASTLIFTRTAQPKVVPEAAKIATQNITTDHMITCSWNATSGWQAPHLSAYGPLTLMPTASVFHYATECFEGTKCYRGYDGALRLFRPDLNCVRLLNSATRISLPAFDPKQLKQLIEALIAVDGEKWLPKSNPGTFLYIRPTMIGTEAGIGPKAPREALLYIIALQFPAFDEMSFVQPPGQVLSKSDAHEDHPKPGMKLLASRNDMVRAWPGGFGWAKVGANYGPSLVAQAEAQDLGYHQVLWLLGEQNEVTEAGTSNFFVLWKTREGELQIVTAPLEDKIILDGVTRRSVLDLARAGFASSAKQSGKLEVIEKKFSMTEVEEAVEEGRMVEAFVTGTGFFILSVSVIHYRGKDLDIPMEAGSSGVYAQSFKDSLKHIMYGDKSHEWGVVVEEHPNRCENSGA
ncbi:MAG: hypothetical protein Q9174_000451 [Haloplaca sp. 1 TL-2023]